MLDMNHTFLETCHMTDSPWRRDVGKTATWANISSTRRVN